VKTLLLNGCSFGQFWNPADHFVSSLGCDSLTNISKFATCFQRTCRTTVEWIAQNGNPEFVLIPITFCHRWELAINKKEDPIDGTWFPLQRKELIDEHQKELRSDVDVDKLKNMLDLYYGSIPTVDTYWDKMFTEIIMLSAFLESRGIKHLFFDMCNEFDKKHINGSKGFDKVKLIESNKNIFDLFNFCGNRYMWNSMANNDNIDFNIHHAPEQLKHLEKYLLTYINQ